MFLKKFQGLTRIQDQLIRIVYAYHYNTRLMIHFVFPASQLELVYDTHINTRLIWYIYTHHTNELIPHFKKLYLKQIFKTF